MDTGKYGQVSRLGRSNRSAGEKRWAQRKW